MIVGAAVIELHVHGSHSLKARRGVVRSIQQRVRNRFNVSISEVGGQDSWQRVLLGLSMTGAEEVPLRRALEKAVAFVEATHLAEVVGSEIELIRLPIEGEAPYAGGAFDPVGAGEPGAEPLAWPPPEYDAGTDRDPDEE